MNEIEIENLAAQAIQAENFSEARRLLEPLSNSGSEYALTTLGWMHEAGKGAQYDLKLAATFYERATEIGCLEAFNSLGRVLWNDGKLEEARKSFYEGAELGNLGCMGRLGIMMFSGRGGPIDLESGMQWIKTAAEKGHVAANGHLLLMERQQSTSVFRHIVYHFKRISLGVHAAKEYSDDPYSGKLF